MGRLQFLSLDRARSADLPWPDVYFTPGYGHAIEASDNAPWECAVWDAGPILFPFLRRPIAGSEDLFDIVSPYGYAGTWAPEDAPVDSWREFRAAFRDAIVDRGGVAEFQRITGLLPGRRQLEAADEEIEISHISDTIAIDVARDFTGCWEAAEGRARTKTRKAKKRGYHWSCRMATLEDCIPGGGFRDLYDATMQRVEAKAYYLFSDEYYQHLLDGLGESLHVVEVRDASGGLGLAGLFMTYGPFVHLHLTGTDLAANRDGAGNLLYSGLIEWSCQRPDLKTLHIGGGLRPNDRLFYFKKSFGGFAVPYHVGKAILAPDKYDSLLAARAATTERSIESLRQSGYFPAYRA